MTVQGAQDHDTPLYDDEARTYDAVLVMSFGGPEGPDDVMPFLRNVTAGRNVPEARLEEVAHHYARFGGISPLNAQNQALADALRAELAAHGPALPVYLGNRNWHPFAADTLRRMRDDGVRRAIAFVTSAYSSYSGCRQYREDLIRAQAEVGPGAPEIDKLRTFANHPRFVDATVERLQEALERIPEADRGDVHVAFTAHSIPTAMAARSTYPAQLQNLAALSAERAGCTHHALVYQSRSGPPSVPWLEPDILDHLDALAARGVRAVVIHPIGFLSDHIEVAFDLDIEAQERADALGVHMVRAQTVGTSPTFIRMIRELIVERATARPDRPFLGAGGPSHDICPVECCLPR